MKRLGILVALFLLLFVSIGCAVDNETLWKQAAEYYDAGEYESAIANYNIMLERNYLNSDIFHNLGNSYYKSGRIGRAIWAYRKALSIDSDMEQARINLEYARRKNIDRIELEKGGFVYDLWNFFSGILGYNGFLIVFSVVWWVLGAITALIIFRGNFASWPYYLLIACFVIAIFSITAAARRIKVDRMTTWGVIVLNAVDIREGPGADFERIEIGHEGLEFKILGERENSFLVELSNGLKGWINKDAILKI